MATMLRAEAGRAEILAGKNGCGLKGIITAYIKHISMCPHAEFTSVHYQMCTFSLHPSFGFVCSIFRYAEVTIAD